ncbi:MAG TPA: hypothetical protein PLP42_10120 [Acidobacteriota bacterium]|nr:hypothetical protein [Acidobacteriota bacterium]
MARSLQVTQKIRLSAQQNASRFTIGITRLTRFTCMTFDGSPLSQAGPARTALMGRSGALLAQVEDVQYG